MVYCSDMWDWGAHGIQNYWHGSGRPDVVLEREAAHIVFRWYVEKGADMGMVAAK